MGLFVAWRHARMCRKTTPVRVNFTALAALRQLPISLPRTGGPGGEGTPSPGRTGLNSPVDAPAIAALLEPFVTGLSEDQLAQVSAYLELLLKWNARTNLTSVRDAPSIVTRHFGESFFAAQQLFPAPDATVRVIDVGSGAGFPGLPLKIYAPALRLVLIESQNKKATFLKEVVRALELQSVEVFAGRAEDFPGTAELVTLRAVEHFSAVLPLAARLVAPTGRLALLIGQAQIQPAKALLPRLSWSESVDIPGSSNRVLIIGQIYES